MSLGGPSFWLATTPETHYPAVSDGHAIQAPTTKDLKPRRLPDDLR